MTITWNSPAKTQNHNHLTICTLLKTHLIHLFQVKQNWLTWNTDRPQRASKQGLAFQVNVRNASTVRNGKEIAVLFPLRARNDVFSSFCARNWTGMQILFPLRTDSKRVAQLMCLGVKYNGDRVRHRFGKLTVRRMI